MFSKQFLLIAVAAFTISGLTVVEGIPIPMSSSSAKNVDVGERSLFVGGSGEGNVGLVMNGKRHDGGDAYTASAGSSKGGSSSNLSSGSDKDNGKGLSGLGLFTPDGAIGEVVPVASGNGAAGGKAASGDAKAGKGGVVYTANADGSTSADGGSGGNAFSGMGGNTDGGSASYKRFYPPPAGPATRPVAPAPLAPAFGALNAATLLAGRDGDVLPATSRRSVPFPVTVARASMLRDGEVDSMLVGRDVEGSAEVLVDGEVSSIHRRQITALNDLLVPVNTLGTQDASLGSGEDGYFFSGLGNGVAHLKRTPQITALNDVLTPINSLGTQSSTLTDTDSDSTSTSPQGPGNVLTSSHLNNLLNGLHLRDEDKVEVKRALLSLLPIGPLTDGVVPVASHNGAPGGQSSSGSATGGDAGLAQ